MKFIKFVFAAIMLGVLAVDVGFAQQPAADAKAATAGHVAKRTIATSASGDARSHRRETGLHAIAGPSATAVGQPAPTAATAPGANVGHGDNPQAAGGGATKNAASVGTSAVGGPSAGQPAIAAAVAVGNVPAAARPRDHGAINGTGMLRVGAGPAAVGGPTAKSAGVNGTSMRPRR